MLGTLCGAPALAQQDSPKTERVRVDGRDISIPAPFQYCDLDATEAREQNCTNEFEKPCRISD